MCGIDVCLKESYSHMLDSCICRNQLRFLPLVMTTVYSDFAASLVLSEAHNTWFHWSLQRPWGRHFYPTATKVQKGKELTYIFPFSDIYLYTGFPGGSAVKHLSAVQEIWVQSLFGEDPSEKEMVIHSRILAWKIQWTEEPGRLWFLGKQGLDMTQQLNHHHLHATLEVTI